MARLQRVQLITLRVCRRSTAYHLDRRQVMRKIADHRIAISGPERRHQRKHHLCRSLWDLSFRTGSGLYA